MRTSGDGDTDTEHQMRHKLAAWTLAISGEPEVVTVISEGGDV